MRKSQKHRHIYSGGQKILRKTSLNTSLLMSVFLVAIVCSITAGEVGHINVAANQVEYAGPLWNVTTVGGEAQPAYPEDGAMISGDPYPLDTSILFTELVFIPGATAVKHTGYLSKVREDVANRVEDANLGAPPYASYPGYEYKYFAGNPDFYPYESLIRGQVYYWTVDETDAEGNTFSGDVWEFTVQDYYAYAPSPPSEATFVSITPILSWEEGYGAQNHDICFGTSLEWDPYPFPIIQPPHSWTLPVGDTDWDPIADGGLTIELETTYYWRVDEVQGRFPPSVGTIYRGDVWSFTTAGGEAQCDYPEDGAVIPGDPYPPDPCILNTELIFIPGPTAVKHTGYLSKVRDKVANRAEDANLGPPPFGSFPGYEYTYFAGNPGIYPFEGLIRGTKYYWTVDETDALGNTFSGDVWEFTVQDFYAFVPSPVDGANNVDPNVLLSWQGGYDVDAHNVYIGTSWQDVNNADKWDLTGIFQGWTFEPSWPCSNLAFNTTYYWRVDEEHNWSLPVEGPIYKGDVWSFTTTSVDLNNDCSINFKDYAILTKDWMKTGTCFSGDINGDDKVNYNDLRILVRNWLCEICNSNSIVQDDIEYYILTDKFAYNSGEEVRMLYRVTNLGSIQVNLGWVPIPPFCYHFVIADSNGEHVWLWSWAMPPMPPVEFILDAYESKEYEIGWDMINDNGTYETEDDFPAVPGMYKITGELLTGDEADRVRVSVYVNVRE